MFQLRPLIHGCKRYLLVTLLCAKPIVHVEYVIIVLIIITIIVDRLAWLGEDTSRIMGRLIFKGGIADVECINDVRRQLSQRLPEK